MGQRTFLSLFPPLSVSTTGTSSFFRGPKRFVVWVAVLHVVQREHEVGEGALVR